jgi:hypothetical protein
MTRDMSRRLRAARERGWTVEPTGGDQVTARSLTLF